MVVSGWVTFMVVFPGPINAAKGDDDVGMVITDKSFDSYVLATIPAFEEITSKLRLPLGTNFWMNIEFEAVNEAAALLMVMVADFVASR